jgi:hypothetical protein
VDDLKTPGEIIFEKEIGLCEFDLFVKMEILFSLFYGKIYMYTTSIISH